jgi:hypothetical protein
VNSSARQPPSTVFEALANRRLLIVSGKGGVGRTTVSALIGLALARRGRRVLVATTGHDDRLAWMMGRDELPETPLEVRPGLSIQRLVPRRCVREYGTLVLKSERLSTAVLDNRVVRRLLRAIPGLDDFSLLGKVWHEALRARSFDVILFDGPATGHLRLNLGVPKAILESVPGGPLVKEAELIQRDLEDGTQVAAVLVGLPERWPLTELGELGASLREDIGLTISTLVVNGQWPDELPEINHLDELSPQLRPVVAAVDRITRRGRHQREQLDTWLEGETAARCGFESVLELGWKPERLDDAAALDGLADQLEASA